MSPRIMDSSQKRKSGKVTPRASGKRLSPGSRPRICSCRRELFSVPTLSTSSKKVCELFEAVDQGDIQKVKDLIQHVGPSVRNPDTGFTLLHSAALRNQKDIAEFLLELISPNVVSTQNQTPAHLAAQEGHLDVLKILLADREANPTIKDAQSLTCRDMLEDSLLRAILSGNTKRTSELLALGANPDCQVDGVVSRELDITTPRQLAVSLNHESILRLFPKSQKSHLNPIQSRQKNPPTHVKGYKIGEDQTLGPLRIKVKARTNGIVEDDVHKMDSDSRGYVCILSFGSFERRPDLELEASEDDASNLANVFTQMGYLGEVHHSLTSDETKETLTRIRDMEELWDASSATFIISSHGTSNNDAFLASDMQQLSTEWLLGLFSDAECPQLKNKPKLFIFDFCRGYYTDSCASVLNSFRPTRVNEPQRDMVCIYSSSTGFTSYNFSKDGSSFPTAFCHTLAKHSHDLELNDIFRELVLECRKTSPLIPLMKNIGFAKKFYFH
ncbi:caspase Dronc-like isoform X2 [Macrobrachium rosenbergii]